MSALARLSTAKARRSPARERLALANNEVLGLHRLVKQAEIVVQRAQSLRDQAAERLEVATASASEAKAGHTGAMLRSARTGEPVATAAATRGLRHAESDARDDLEAAQAAFETAEAERDEALANRDLVGREVVHARDAVLVENFEPYLDDVRAGLADLHRRCAPLKFLASVPGLAQDQESKARMFAENVRLTLQRSTNQNSGFDVAEWEAAAKALLSDPDAPLPPVGGTS